MLARLPADHRFAENLLRRLLILPLFLLVAAPLIAQAPHADWRTIETSHFRVHFPVEFEEWAREAVGRLEGMREPLIAEIGYAPAGKIDVLVMDPVAQANGMALPLLTAPRMILWTNPPGPESVIGNYTSWIDLLAVHEYTHLIHILRPSRNPFQRAVERILPIGPIGLRAPRWVVEGYATVIEGDMSGAGRPNSDLRASVLRRWAQLGRLPSYGAMAADSESWMGMSMAYLAGSTYLEWLRAREGDGSLRDLWSRLTARRKRSFNEAFEGVYGESPRRLYDRFRAEVTHDAMVVERQREQTLREGELWQDLSWTTEPPHVTPDGTRLLTVLRDREDPPTLVIYSTEVDEEKEREQKERIERMLERDPQDVAPVRRTPLEREPLHSIRARTRAEGFDSPRWMPDLRSVLFTRFEPDSDGILHADLFTWTPEEGRVRRVTRLADVRHADPAPDGRWAVAVRNRFGRSQLVRVDLDSAEVTEITEPSVSEVYHQPRLDPAGQRVAFIRHRDGRWQLFVRDLATGEETLVPIEATLLAQPAWSPSGDALYLTMGRNGFIEVARVPPGGGPVHEVTRSHGGSLAPTVSEDSLYFLSLDVDGFDIRRLPLREASPLPAFEMAGNVWPVAGRWSREVRTRETAEVGPSQPYGLGRQELSILFGGNYSEASNMLELGLRSGDVVGRVEALLFGSAGGSRGPEGAAAAAAWRGWPIGISAHLFTADEDLAGPFISRRDGAELRAEWTRRGRNRFTVVDGGGFLGRADGDDEQVAFAGFAHQGELRRGDSFLGGAAVVDAHSGRFDGLSWDRVQANLTGGIGLSDIALHVSYGRGMGSGRAGEPLFVLGGVASTIVPASAWSGRVLEPALEVGILSGSDYERASADLELAGFPLTGFYQRYRFWNEGTERGEWFDLAGLRYTFAWEAMPIIQFPAFELQLGVARTLDEPVKDKTRWWFGLVFRP
jgi:hypothetical protein